MSDEPVDIVNRLTKYVNMLEEERSKEPVNKKRLRGASVLLYNALDKLRAAYNSGKLSPDLLEKIKAEKIRSGLKFPKGNYINVCWQCHNYIDTRVDETCKTCEWVKCPKCGACRDPKFGGCSEFGSNVSR